MNRKKIHSTAPVAAVPGMLDRGPAIVFDQAIHRDARADSIKLNFDLIADCTPTDRTETTCLVCKGIIHGGQANICEPCKEQV